MPKSDNQKLKILYILDYLQKYSHQDHPVRANEIIAMLNKHDINCDRKTVYADIAALQDYGMDIQCIPGRNGGYYLESGNFEKVELKLLIDAVQFSRFITEKKSHQLIEKLCTLCNEDDARLMRRDVYVSGRAKNINETIYYNVDAIQEAIAQNRQITFRYFDWGLDDKRIYREKAYEASPYGLYQDNENCYLLAHSSRHGPTTYRVDRMTNIELRSEARVRCPELMGKNLIEFANKRINMFDGETTSVKMRFHKRLANVVVDRFGPEVMRIPDDDDHFVFTVSVAVSPQFLSWVIGLGPDAKIVYPNSVVDACKDLCRKALALYE